MLAGDRAAARVTLTKMSARPSCTTLFSTGAREVSRSLPASASAYHRLDQTGGAFYDELRETLDEWFGRLPAPARAVIGAAFRRPALGDHLGAFWEIYVHELASRLDWEVEVDIGCEDPEQQRPDFLLHRDAASVSVSVEATVVLGDDAVHPADQRRVAQLYDAIERIGVRDFLLHVRPVRVGTTTPGRRTLGRPLERWLRTLEYEEVLALRDSDRPRPRRTFAFEDWQVAIEASAWLPELRGRPDLGVIGSKTEGVGRVADVDTFKQLSDVEPIARELRRKAGQYGKPDRPFVLAALCAGPFVSEHDIAQGLIGPISYRIGSHGSSGGYEPGGLWLGPEGLRNRRVSAVLTASALAPTGIAAVEPVLWTAPGATHPLTSESPLRTFAFDPTGAVTERPATRSAADILALTAQTPT